MRKFIHLLIFVCFISAIAVIWVRHENREQIIELHYIYEERDNLNIEWQRLLIELTAMSRYDQLENWARANDSMQAPDEEGVVFLNARQASDTEREVAQ